jgi:hypothetical protein
MPLRRDVLVDTVEIGFFGDVRKVASLDLFADVAIDQALKSNRLPHRQAIVDFRSEPANRFHCESGGRCSRHHCRSSSGKNWPSTFSPAGITGTP